MHAIVTEPLDASRVAAAVRRADAGAVIVFEGVTRNHHNGRPVIRLEYESYAPMAESEMVAIAKRIQRRWPEARVAMLHRVGVVPIGEASVIIAVSAPHRAEAYAASRVAIDELKARVPVWKKEVYADGEAWVANKEAST